MCVSSDRFGSSEGFEPTARWVKRGWNNHHTLHGGNHLMLKPLDPLIPEAKLSHTVITSAPFLLLDLQCARVCVCEMKLF